MSITFSPTSGSTISFGTTVVVGTSVNFNISAHFHSPNSSDPGQYSYVVNSFSITGTDAAMFSVVDLPGPFYGPGDDDGGGLLTFAPTSTGAKTATLTWNYTLTSNGVPTTTNGTYTLNGTAISNPSPPTNPNEVASLLQSFRYLLVPTQGTTGKVLSFYDSTNLNDATDASTYVFKAEDIHADRVPTVRRVMVTYVDLGVATIVVNVSGYNDNGTLTQGQDAITIGTAGASGAVLTAFADLSVTCFRPQVKIIRTANAGPVQIVHVLATGTIEREVTL